METKMTLKTICELVLSILFIIFSIMDYKIPYKISGFITSVLGKLVLLAIVIYLFMNCNPILAVLAVVVAIKIINGSTRSKYIPSEEKKFKELKSFNSNKKTLEEMVISKLKPLSAKITRSPYQPVLSNNHDANEL